MPPFSSSNSAPSAARATTPTFRERYCLARGLVTAEYTDAMLRECLYPHARWLRPLLPPDFFSPDRDFINAFGLIRQREEAISETKEFQGAEANRHHFLRRWLRLRLSIHRVRLALQASWSK